MKNFRKTLIKVLTLVLLFITMFAISGCASCGCSCKSCASDVNGGLYRIVNIYSLDGKLLATYEGKIDIDDNTNGSIMFDLNDKRYVYYNAIVEVIEQ